jgi:1-acyl-sn-glycerol-3-phosphate acyltransferase
MTSKFDEIRPYNNADLPLILSSLVQQKEFIDTLVAHKFAKWPSVTKPVLAFFTKWFVVKEASKIQNIKEFQALIEPYIKRMIKTSTTSLSVSGLDTLDLSKPCLFMSNHRDIALDPAFVNWVLHINGKDTVRIAVGDNLLRRNWVADLFRLNKCFVVKRTVEGRREKLNAAKLLSEYINHSLKVDQQHLWIAQREGRAKDGIDTTNNAILSMLSMHKPKDLDFGDYMSQLRIVPVSISYEFDPCDINKAKEMHRAEKTGAYDKQDNEDMQSIVEGITGQKGRVHIHFGKLLGSAYTNTKEVAKYLDDEILAAYNTFSTAHAAISLLKNYPNYEYLSQFSQENELDNQEQDNLSVAHQYLETRLGQLNIDEQQKLLCMYANPLLRKHASRIFIA